MAGRTGTRRFVVALWLVLGLALRLQAMDRWAALSQIESGNSDCAIGAAGEVSRYQMKPDVWRQYAATNADWQKPEDALRAAQEVMKDRCAVFEETFHRLPTDFEFYILWNAPGQIRKPGKAVRERAGRFCNLVSRD